MSKMETNPIKICSKNFQKWQNLQMTLKSGPFKNTVLTSLLGTKNCFSKSRDHVLNITFKNCVLLSNFHLIKALILTFLWA